MSLVRQVMNFYRRQLPSFCISFSSEEGKLLFKEAMVNGQMENYFRLASQLRTQDEPSFCGLATLVMVLNALEIDPGRVWKGPWRWYHEEMLDCCIPLDTVKSKGVTLDQFICISKCNGLTANFKRVSENQSFEDFQNTLMRITRIDEEILVCSYSRKLLGQTGTGHFASVGGYHPAKKMVLLFDTARFKYPSHWVPVESLWEAMKDIDSETGQPRGYVVFMKDADSSCLLLLSTSVELNEFMMMRKKIDSFAVLIQNWNNWLKMSPSTIGDEMEIVRSAARYLLNELLKMGKSGEKLTFPLTCHSHFSQEVTDELETAMSAIIKEVVECEIGNEVGKIILSLDGDDLKMLSDSIFILPKLFGCSLLILQDKLVKMTFLLVSWLMVTAPIKNATHATSANPTHAEFLQKLSSDVIFKEFCLQSQMELVQLSNKISKMSNCRDKISCCTELTNSNSCHT